MKVYWPLRNRCVASAVFVLLVFVTVLACSQKRSTAGSAAKSESVQHKRVVIQVAGMSRSSLYADSVRRVLQQELELEVELLESVDYGTERLRAYAVSQAVKRRADLIMLAVVPDFDDRGVGDSEVELKLLQTRGMVKLYDDVLALDARFEELFKRSIQQSNVSLEYREVTELQDNDVINKLNRQGYEESASKYAQVYSLNQFVDDAQTRSSQSVDMGGIFFMDIEFENLDRGEQTSFSSVVKSSRLAREIQKASDGTSRIYLKHDTADNVYHLELFVPFSPSWYQSELKAGQSSYKGMQVVSFKPYYRVMDQLLWIREKFRQVHSSEIAPAQFKTFVVLVRQNRLLKLPVEKGSSGQLVHPDFVVFSSGGQDTIVGTLARTVYERLGLFVLGKPPLGERHERVEQFLKGSS